MESVHDFESRLDEEPEFLKSEFCTLEFGVELVDHDDVLAQELAHRRAECLCDGSVAELTLLIDVDAYAIVLQAHVQDFHDELLQRTLACRGFKVRFNAIYVRLADLIEFLLYVGTFDASHYEQQIFDEVDFLELWTHRT